MGNAYRKYTLERKMVLHSYCFQLKQAHEVTLSMIKQGNDQLGSLTFSDLQDCPTDHMKEEYAEQ